MRIFISHSRKDPQTVFFERIFGRIEGAGCDTMEFEDYDLPPWQEIRERVKKAGCLFVLLSPYLLDEKRYTSNWVSYEIGLADQAGKAIWVFEQSSEAGMPIAPFPIPHVDHYVIYDAEDPEWQRYIRWIVETHLVYRSRARIERILTQEAVLISCPYSNCGGSYYLHSTAAREILCPMCRQRVTIGEDS